MDKTPEDYYRDYMEMLESGDLAESTHLYDEALDNPAFAEAMIRASRDYAMRNGPPRTMAARRRCLVATHTIIRRINNGQVVRRRLSGRAAPDE